MASTSYATDATKQAPGGAPARAPTLDELHVEHDRLTARCNDLRRQIHAGYRFVEQHHPARPIAKRIVANVRRNVLLLADTIDERDAVQRQIDRLETAYFGWRVVPPGLVP